MFLIWLFFSRKFSCCKFGVFFSRKFSCCKFGVFFSRKFCCKFVFCFPDVNFDAVNLAFLIHYDYEVLIHYSDK